MFIAEKRIANRNWEALAEVNTGESFLIQNISEDIVRYCVLDSQPENTVFGGVILPYQQLGFKKVTGDLYVKQNGDEDGFIVIERVEEA